MKSKNIDVNKLTLNDIKNISNPVLRVKYREEWDFIIRNTVIPLYMKLDDSNFIFTAPHEQLTLEMMIDEMTSFEQKIGKKK